MRYGDCEIKALEFTAGRIFQAYFVVVSNNRSFHFRLELYIDILTCLQTPISCFEKITLHPLPLLWFGFSKLLRNLWVVFQERIYTVTGSEEGRESFSYRASIEKNSTNILSCSSCSFAVELAQCNFIHATTHFVIHIEWIGWCLEWINIKYVSRWQSEWRTEEELNGGGWVKEIAAVNKLNNCEFAG